ncbi:hypothetical protein K504DRAFT_63923 [Pleomassaria siparia CBS 279.74]|uniref:Uncharacterized protein n=1 Tax=Pleomassaria siparia CBS 279.74 TaxID=1314801 RepID=A0A6G1K2J8_9PLEO|nr:hypothetical protein K504DRAFT_63923 [Pleomassaria siparia CBS 279.74]
MPSSILYPRLFCLYLFASAFSPLPFCLYLFASALALALALTDMAAVFISPLGNHVAGCWTHTHTHTHTALLSDSRIAGPARVIVPGRFHVCAVVWTFMDFRPEEDNLNMQRHWSRTCAIHPRRPPASSPTAELLAELLADTQNNGVHTFYVQIIALGLERNTEPGSRPHPLGHRKFSAAR